VRRSSSTESAQDLWFSDFSIHTYKAVRNALVSNQHEVEVFGTHMPRYPEELADRLNALPPTPHSVIVTN
jgi:hypothetical protein